MRRRTAERAQRNAGESAFLPSPVQVPTSVQLLSKVDSKVQLPEDGSAGVQFPAEGSGGVQLPVGISGASGMLPFPVDGSSGASGSVQFPVGKSGVSGRPQSSSGAGA